MRLAAGDRLGPCEILAPLGAGGMGQVMPSVSDSSLTIAVVQARAAIGDDAREPELVRRVHGFGYAFAGTLIDEASPLRTWI
jgi:hypothetical protein